MACPAGIEPATHSLEGCCSIQLSYGQIRDTKGPKTGLCDGGMVGAAGFELATLCSQSRCATRLRYAPTNSILTCEQEAIA